MTTFITRPKSKISKAETGLRRFVFRDISLKGLSHPLTGDLTTVSDYHAVSQSIKNIVLTNKKERFFDHIEFGVGIEHYLFKIFDSGLTDLLKEDILIELSKYEPRAFYNNIYVNGTASKHQLEIQIEFTIKTTNVADTVTILIERT
jgi:phage baseplate assembly protein W